MLGDVRAGDPHDPGLRRRRDRARGGRALHAARCAGARLVRERATPGRLALPVDRPARRQRAVHLRGARAREGSGHLELAPPLRPIRPLPRARRRHGRGAGCARALDSASGDPAAARRPPGARRAGNLGLRARGLQLALALRLDAGGGGRPRRRALCVRLAREPRLRGRGLPGSLPRGPPRPGRQARVHLDSGRRRVRPERRARPHRLGARRGARADARERDRRRARRAGRRHRDLAVPDRPSRGRLHVRGQARRGACARRAGDTPPGDRPEPVGRLPRARTARRAGGDRPRRSTRAPSPRRRSTARTALSPSTRRGCGAVPTRSSSSTGATTCSRGRRSGSTGRRRADPRRDVEAGLHEGEADPGLLVERARHALGLARDLPRRRRAARPRTRRPGCNAGYCGNDGYLLYEYTKTAIEGTATFSGSSATGDGAWPLRPGLYEVRLLLDDGYKSVAKSLRFRIVPR